MADIDKALPNEVRTELEIPGEEVVEEKEEIVEKQTSRIRRCKIWTTAKERSQSSRVESSVKTG